MRLKEKSYRPMDRGLQKKDEKKLRTTEICVLRMIVAVTRRKRLRNEEVGKRGVEVAIYRDEEMV